MRSLLFGLLIIGLTLVDFTPAGAQGRQYSYSACMCRFGFSGNSSGDRCEIKVSCRSEGGWCVKSCPRKVGE
jgi:hypothetical protein